MATHGLSDAGSKIPQVEISCFSNNPNNDLCKNLVNAQRAVSSKRIGSYGIKVKDNILVCGGVSEATRSPILNCDTLKSLQLWNQDSVTFREGKTYAAFAQTLSGEFFVTGGFTGNLDNNYLSDEVSSRTQIIVNEKLIKDGPDLPKALACHSMIHIEDRYFMISGGIDTKFRLASPGSFYINYVTGDYLELPLMELGRANHAALKHVSEYDREMRIFVAGGRHFSTQGSIGSNIQTLYTKTTEIFLPKNRTWTQGPDLPFTLAFASVVYTPKGNWIVGGKTDPNNINSVSFSFPFIEFDHIPIRYCRLLCIFLVYLKS